MKKKNVKRALLDLAWVNNNFTMIDILPLL